MCNTYTHATQMSWNQKIERIVFANLNLTVTMKNCYTVLVFESMDHFFIGGQNFLKSFLDSH